MVALSMDLATEKLATGVEKASPSALAEIYAELFPERDIPTPPKAQIIQYIRNGLAAEEIVDLWNVVFPADHNVWYDEEEEKIHFNEEVVGYSGTE